MESKQEYSEVDMTINGKLCRVRTETFTNCDGVKFDPSPDCVEGEAKKFIVCSDCGKTEFELMYGTYKILARCMYCAYTEIVYDG